MWVAYHLFTYSFHGHYYSVYFIVNIPPPCTALVARVIVKDA